MSPPESSAMQERTRNTGYTLVELLVVLAIIALMTSIAVPVMVSSGFFSSDKSRTGARDLFAQLRAATVHARTNNVTAALAYDVEQPQDSLFEGTVGTNVVRSFVPAVYSVQYPEVANVNFDAERPVLTETLLVRQLTINELFETDSTGLSLAEYIIADDPDDEYTTYTSGVAGSLLDDIPFVPANTTFGQFEALPAETSVQVNHPAVLETNGLPADFTNFVRETGLQSIAVFFIYDEDDVFQVDRVFPKVKDPDLTDTNYFNRGLPDPGGIGVWNNRFPAHVFSKTGALDMDDNVTDGLQRIQLNIGLKPDAPFFERYMVDEENDDIIFTNGEYFGVGVKDVDDDLVAIDTGVTIYVPSGRVVVEADDGT